MRTLIWTITVLVSLALVMTPAPAQPSTEKELQKALDAVKADAESAANDAQQQSQESLNQTDAAQKDADNAAAKQDSLAYALAVQSSALPARSLDLLRYTPQSILVIPADEIKTEDLATITEDVGIMCRVLDKKLEQEARIATRRTLLPFGGDTETEGIYLEGYGALFVLNVNLPLTPPPETKKEEQPKEEGDPLWEETRHELYSTNEDADHTRFGVVYMRSGLDHLSEEYDPEKVEQLKTTLVKSLKHAANLRNLKSDESVIITVKGCAPPAVIEETVVEREEHGSRTHSKSISATRSVPVQKIISDERSVASTVLTIRTKKSDIDLFSKGQVTFDQFRQKVRIHTYQTSGRNIASELTESNQHF